MEKNRMAGVLRALAALSPGQLILWSWVVMFACSALGHVGALDNLGTAVGLLVLIGYPNVVALGLPAQRVSPGTRRWALVFFVGTCLLLLALGTGIPSFDLDVNLDLAAVASGAIAPPQIAPQTILGALIGLVAVSVVLVAPFLLATAALNQARRSLGEPGADESVRTFFALNFAVFGGYVFVHRRVQATLAAHARH